MLADALRAVTELGGETSERHWRDVLGVIAVQRGRLDEAAILSRAKGLGVDDLAIRALADTTGGI